MKVKWLQYMYVSYTCLFYTCMACTSTLLVQFMKPTSYTLHQKLSGDVQYDINRLEYESLKWNEEDDNDFKYGGLVVKFSISILDLYSKFCFISFVF